MSATVDIITERVSDQLTVPIQAVTARTEEDVFKMQKDTMSFETKKALEDDDESLSQEKKEYVFVVRNGQVELKSVVSDIQDDDYIVVKGLEPGDTVVSAPYRAITKSLKLGEEVEIVDKDDLY